MNLVATLLSTIGNTELNGAPGKKKEFVVSHIVTEHEPNETSEENPLIGISGMVYVR